MVKMHFDAYHMKYVNLYFVLKNWTNIRFRYEAKGKHILIVNRTTELQNK